MKVLAIAPYRFLPAENGGQKAIENLYRSLLPHVELTVVSTPDNDLSKDHGFELLPLLGKSKLRYADPFIVFSLTNFIKKREITHLIIEHPYMGWLGIALRRTTGCRLIVHSHNIEGQRFASMQKWWAGTLASYERYVHKNADLSLFITNEDRLYAIKAFGLEEKRTMVVPFAVTLTDAPSFEEKKRAKERICSKHGIDIHVTLLIYSGAFNYAPNLNGLRTLLQKILPLIDIPYHLLICGKDVPQELSTADHNVTFTGFVSDIHEYYAAAEVFLNPVTEGGGIKTKLVDALAGNCNAVSARTGAIGIPQDLTGEKLLVVADNDHHAFAETIKKAIHIHSNIPPAFFTFFSADHIGRNVFQRLNSL